MRRAGPTHDTFGTGIHISGHEHIKPSQRAGAQARERLLGLWQKGRRESYAVALRNVQRGNLLLTGLSAEALALPQGRVQGPRRRQVTTLVRVGRAFQVQHWPIHTGALELPPRHVAAPAPSTLEKDPPCRCTPVWQGSACRLTE